MRRMHVCLTLLCALGLTACSGPSTPTPAAKSARTDDTKTPWDPMLKDLARAQSVQGVVDRQAERQREAIGKQTH